MGSLLPALVATAELLLCRISTGPGEEECFQAGLGMWLLANYKWMKNGNLLSLVIRKGGNDKQWLELEA